MYIAKICITKEGPYIKISPEATYLGGFTVDVWECLGMSM